MEFNTGLTTKYRKSVTGETCRDILKKVYEALKEKGYNPINQIVGYLISGDPTYVTGYKNARFLITTMERDEILEALVSHYLESLNDSEAKSEE